MNNEQPSIQEWKELYEAAIAFKEHECWNWMADSDIFGVQNPKTGEVNYCCIMGRAGTHFALGVYLGAEGLDGYLKIQSDEFPAGDPEAMHVQKCLMASFEDRGWLQKPDLESVKKLGLKFRGMHSWPMFRSYLLGYHPGYLTKEEAAFLTVALKQAVEVALRFKENPKMLEPPKENLYLVRVLNEETKVWVDTWMEPEHFRKSMPEPESIDMNRLERIKKNFGSQRGVWEIDYFYSPSAVQEEKNSRPRYPPMAFWVDKDSYFIMHFWVSDRGESIPHLAEETLGLIERMKFMPVEMHVKTDEAQTLLEQTASGLGIKIRKLKALRSLDDARRGMYEWNTMPRKKQKGGDFWAEGEFGETMTGEDAKKRMKTLHKKNDKNMNFSCKKCNKKISAHNKDWHDGMCDDCFHKAYFHEDEA